MNIKTAAAAIFTVCLISARSNAATFPTGIYWLMNVQNDSGLQSAMQLSYVDGATLRYRWADLEPAEGTYTFGMLDSDVGTIAAAGKHAQIMITPGQQSPCWLKTAGAGVYADYSTFDTYCAGNPAARFLTADSANNMVVPLPWDATYQAKWKTFITALSDHIGATNSTATVSGIVVTGINAPGGEVTLPNGSDAAGWQAVGYSNASVRNAYLVFLNDWAAAFPNISLSSRYRQDTFPAYAQPCRGSNQVIPRELNDIAYQNYPTLSVMGYNGLDDTAHGNLLPQMCPIGGGSQGTTPWADCEYPNESCRSGSDANAFSPPDGGGTPIVVPQGLQENHSGTVFQTEWNTAQAAFPGSTLKFIEVYPTNFNSSNAAALTAAHNVLITH